MSSLHRTSHLTTEIIMSALKIGDNINWSTMFGYIWHIIKGICFNEESKTSLYLALKNRIRIKEQE